VRTFRAFAVLLACLIAWVGGVASAGVATTERSSVGKEFPSWSGKTALAFQASGLFAEEDGGLAQLKDSEGRTVAGHSMTCTSRNDEKVLHVMRSVLARDQRPLLRVGIVELRV